MKVYTGKPNNMRQVFSRKGLATKRVNKKKYRCFDGPFAGHDLMLSDGTTAVMTVGNKKGKYVEGEWVAC